MCICLKWFSEIKVYPPVLNYRYIKVLNLFLSVIFYNNNVDRMLNTKVEKIFSTYSGKLKFRRYSKYFAYADIGAF